MTFESVGNFAFLTAKKYKLQEIALGALICEKSRTLIVEKYPEFEENWIPQKFSDRVLFIQATHSSAASNLFLRTHEFIEFLNQKDLPVSVLEIRIVRNNSKEKLNFSDNEN